jgi:methylated-DNA-[protein]-cysteine S-methyltransferase
MKFTKKMMLSMQRYPAFYQKVWRACAEIPRGEVRTYGWIAQVIGHPGAARAVGQALAANPFAPHVPCHRVVSSTGGLTGYSAEGGIERKRQLLEQEGALLTSAKAKRQARNAVLS